MRLRVMDDGHRGPGQVSLAVYGAVPAPRGPGPGMLLNPTAAAAAQMRLEPAALADGGEPARAQAVVLTDARLDQVAGLIGLRGPTAIDLYATPAVFEDLTTTLPVLPQLQRHCDVHWHLVPVAGDQRQADFAVRGHEGLALTAWDLAPAGAACLDPEVPPQTGRCIALQLHERASGRRALYLGGVPEVGAGVEQALRGVDCVLFEPGERLDPRAADWLRALRAPRTYLLGAAHAHAAPDLPALAEGEEIEV